MSAERKDTADVIAVAAARAQRVEGIEALRAQVRQGLRPAEAATMLAAIAEDATEANDRVGLAEAHLGLAAMARYRHDLGSARHHAIRARQLFAECGHDRGRADAHLELAKIYCEGGEPTHMQLAQARLAAPSEATEAQINSVRASAALGQGAWAEARRQLRWALSLLKATAASAYDRASYRARLGMIERLTGEATATEHLLGALEAAVAGGFVRLQAYCELELGLVALERGDLITAAKELKGAARRFTAIDDDLGRAHALSALGEVWRRQGRIPHAIALLERARDLCTAHGHVSGEAMAHRRLAEAYSDYLQARQDAHQPVAPELHERAAAEVAVALRQFEQLGARHGQAPPPAIRLRLLALTEGGATMAPPATAAGELRAQLHRAFDAGPATATELAATVTDLATDDVTTAAVTIAITIDNTTTDADAATAMAPKRARARRAAA